MDSSSTSASCVGSNPTGVNLAYIFARLRKSMPHLRNRLAAGWGGAIEREMPTQIPPDVANVVPSFGPFSCQPRQRRPRDCNLLIFPWRNCCLAAKITILCVYGSSTRKIVDAKKPCSAKPKIGEMAYLGLLEIRDGLFEHSQREADTLLKNTASDLNFRGAVLHYFGLPTL